MQPSLACPNCNADAMKPFYHVKSVPTNSCILLDSIEDATGYPRGDVDLQFCRNCGFISNMAFDEKLTEYSGRYEETQGFSDTFNEFHEKLANRLIDKHNLTQKTVLEIGCGKGEFITLLSELGDNSGVGFDPGYREDHIKGIHSPKVKFIKDFYSEAYADYKADFICCKMTLEHIHPTARFIHMLRQAIGDNLDTLVFFQIPEATRILKSCAFEDIYYEHCSYFTPGSLARLFRSNDFDVLDIDIEYDNQYLTIEARPRQNARRTPLPIEESVEELERLVSSFHIRSKQKMETWNKKLATYAKEGKKVVLWGSGSKGVSFLTTLDSAGSIKYVVDINPYRQGYFMSGTGQQIVAPDFLEHYRPDTVIVMNSIYTDEIGLDLGGRNLHPEILTLDP